MAMLLHQNTTSVTLPERLLGKDRRRYLLQYNTMMDAIAKCAPRVQRLHLGETLPKLLSSATVFIVNFSLQLRKLHNLQVLDAANFRCVTKHIELIASETPNLR
jgi:hypothetical protein